jgi:hypothetical protein
MNTSNLSDFLKNDIRGLILIAILTSIVSAILYDFLKQKYLLLASKMKTKLERRTRVKHIKRIIIDYAQGYKVGYAKSSSYQQVAVVGEFIIRTVVLVGYALFSLIGFVALNDFLPEPISWVCVIVFSFIITIQYRRLKDHLEQFDLFTTTIFGDDFKDAEKKAVTEYLDGRFRKKSENNTAE